MRVRPPSRVPFFLEVFDMGNDIYDIFNTFMTTYDLYPKPIPQYPNYQIDRMGTVYDMNGNKIRPYQYRDTNQYDMTYVRDEQNKPHVFGIHQLVAMTFLPDYYPGCIVHHKDENKYNNWDTNLEITDRSEHASHHNPYKYSPIKAICDVCGNEFIWTSERQKLYYSDIRRGKNRAITCSKSCSSYIGRMTQLSNL